MSAATPVDRGAIICIARFAACGVLFALIAAICGCHCPGAAGVPPVDARDALYRVNRNLARIERTLYCPSTVSFKFKDSGGVSRSFIGQSAILIFRAPQSLRFDVKSLTGVIAQFGSNDERFWFWIEPEVRKLWWGFWADPAAFYDPRFPVPADRLLDALALRPLPLTAADGDVPRLMMKGRDHRLIYTLMDAAGTSTVTREVRLDPCEPYQPIEIIDSSADGQVLMRAELGDYRRIGRYGPYAPRRYVVRWPTNAAEMRLDFNDAKFRDDIPDWFCEFPSEWQGAAEQIGSGYEH